MPDTSSVRTVVVESSQALSEILCHELRSRGHQAVAAPTVAGAREQMNETEFDVALLDLVLSDGSGIDLLRQIAEQNLATEAIILTGEATVSTAIEAIKLGAYDYVVKPARMDEIEALVLKAAEKARLRRENQALKVRVQRHQLVEGLLTEDPAFKEILVSLDRIAQADLPVLIQGERGSGQESVARAVHRLSPRSSFPFEALNCAAFPETALESELFGQEGDSFTGVMIRKPGLFEVAERGVVFLDEVGEIPPSLQVKLLRALESQEIFRVGSTRPVRTDVRIVSATNQSLKRVMQGGGLREDLYDRLNGVTLTLPPLRERSGDIPLLAKHLAHRFAPHKKLSSKALTSLRGYRWPGNLRELQLVIERAAILSTRETLEPEDFPLDIQDQNRQGRAVGAGHTLADIEREYIQTVLVENGGHRGRTAKALGIDPKTLYNKLGPGRPRKKN